MAPEMPKERLRSLVIDDEKNIRLVLTVCLKELGHEVVSVETADLARASLEKERFDLAFLDIRLGDTDGVDLLSELIALRPNLAVIVISAYATFESAVLAVQRGAQSFLPKPFTPAQVKHVVEQTVEQRTLWWKVADLERRLSETAPEVDLSTESAALQETLQAVTRAAPADATVLLRGESGTGKGVLAYALHRESPRRDRPFVTVNCPTLSEELLASELFGHTKGAFTGAVRDQEGRVEAADGGTLFLDEIAELTPPLQAKLLRFLQEHRFERVGDNRSRTADVRVVAATNRNIEDDVAAGRFRQDLLYRLNVIELTIPPLRERKEDICRLATRFLAFFATKARRPPPTLSPAAAHALRAYDWPGNVRELRNVMERVAILWPAQLIEPAAFPHRIGGASGPRPNPELGGDFTVDQIEQEHIVRILSRAPSAENAARILGIDASTLWRKRRRYAL